MDKYEAIRQDALWVLSMDYGTRTQGREHQLRQQAERIAEFARQYDEAYGRLYSCTDRLLLIGLKPSVPEPDGVRGYLEIPQGPTGRTAPKV